MLVRITEKCNMGCNHCMINANPKGAHMSPDTYKEVLKFIEWTKIPLILISGGEPTQHPKIIEMIEMALNKKFKIILLSNGTFIEDEYLKNKIIDLSISVQITNDKRFYPRKVPVINNENFHYTNKIRIVSPFQRALINNLSINRQSPLCFNLRSIIHNLKDFRNSLIKLRMMGKMCTPSINIDGSLAAGESNICSIFGSVIDRNNLNENLLNLRCNKCGLTDKLDIAYKRAIGEGSEKEKAKLKIFKEVFRK